MGKWIMIVCLALSAHLSAEINVLALAGSTREASVNKKLINEAARIAQQMNVNTAVFNLKDNPIPLYEGDLEAEHGMPANVKKLRQMMIKSDIILIASPEFNGSVSGLLKNVIDWASRSETGEPSREAFKGKKFIIMSASPGPGGGARGLVHLTTILENLGGIVLPQQLTVANAYNAFDEQGHLKDLDIKLKLQKIIESAIQP